MSIINSFDDALDFHPGSRQLPALSRLGRMLATYWTAFREGLAAARTYTELTRRGVPHDAAVQHLFGKHFKR